MPATTPPTNPGTPLAEPRAESLPPHQEHRAPAPHRTRRWLRWFAAALAALVGLLLCATAALWWWAGSDQSLATTLARVAPYLPADQQLESREVQGSLRSGGRIGWLRWSSPSLVVELEDLRTGWQLLPLLQRRFALSEIHIARLQITPQGSPNSEPPKPLEQLPLPLQLHVPFAIDRLQWAGTPAIEAEGLQGDYRYDGQSHQLKIQQLDIAQGSYSAQASLKALAPMALQVRLQGQVQATPAGEGAQPLQVSAQATVQGTLSGPDATLQVQAQLEPEPAPQAADTKPSTDKGVGTAKKNTEVTAPMRAQVQATVKPWAPHPLHQATADLQALNLGAVWPQAPATLLSGLVRIEPLNSTKARGANAASPAETPASAEATAAKPAPGWDIHADLRNALPGPWDSARLPLAALVAQAQYDGARWSVPHATLTVGNGAAAGTLDLQGHFTPATGAADAVIQLLHLRPDVLHSALAAAPLNGRIHAQGQGDQAVRFSADVHADGAAPSQPPVSARKGAGTSTTAPLRIQTFTAQGQWQQQASGGTVRIERLLLDALQARIEASQLQIDIGPKAAQGQLQVSAPGLTGSFKGRIAPHQGQGDLQLQLADAERAQHWLSSLPGMAQAPLASISARGQAQLSAQWVGGWQSALDQVQAAASGKKLPSGKNSVFNLQTKLSTAQLDLTLPPAAGTSAASTVVQLRGVLAELTGSITQAQLALNGEARSGNLRANVHSRLSGGLGSSGLWQAQFSALRLQAQDSQRPGPWKLELVDPLSLSLRAPATAPNGSAKMATASAALTLETSAGQARLQGPVAGTVSLRWQPVRYNGGGANSSPPLRLQTQGTLQGLPMAWVDALSALDANGQPAAPLLSQLGLGGDLVLDGAWSIDTSTGPLKAHASLHRSAGDVRILTGDSNNITAVHSSGQGTGAGAATAQTKADSHNSPLSTQGTAAGVREAVLSLDLEGEALHARLLWNSERAGEIDAQASTRLTLGSELSAISLAADAPLVGTLKARLPDVGVWSVLAPPGWRVRGTLDANVALAGTRAAPTWSGTLGADQLALRSLLDGVDLQGGRLRAALRGNSLEITDFRLQGGSGSKARIPGYSGNRSAPPQDGGLLTGTGRVSWGAANAAEPNASGIRMDFQAEAKALQVLVRADRQVSVSGQVNAKLDQGQFSVRGKLTADRATIILPDETAPSLGSDVVVRSAAKDREAQAKAQAAAQANQKAAQAETAKPPDIAITVNLGQDFALQGLGITTRLTGALDVRSSSTPGAPPRVMGEISTEQGRYRAWGQELDVETGLIRFNGPYNNPSLDILALRPNISVRAGVQVTGSALAPRVRLYSDPELPDAAKLSWVVLGRDAAAGGTEAALLQQAALALLGGNGGGGLTDGIAHSLGLDEIGFKGPGTGDDASAAALTFGKRLSKDLYVTYERSLSGTLGTLYIFYDLSRRLTLRGQTGEKSAVDIIYTVKYD